jgi:hypothetical protein
LITGINGCATGLGLHQYIAAKEWLPSTGTGFLMKPFMSDLQSTQPRPIEVTDSVSNSDRADVKALENAKTEKVNMVIVVMNLYGHAKSSSNNANAKNSAKKTKLESKSKELDLN